MSKLRGLIVDDSELVQDVLKTILESDDGIEIVGVAGNGQEGVEKVEALKPDFVTMDIAMPIMDGISAIKYIMANNPTPILVISDIGDSTVAYIALSHGALEVISKSDLQPAKADILIEKIKHLAKVDAIAKQAPGSIKKPVAPVKTKLATVQVVAMAGATGGARALSIILPALPADFPCPILISLHTAEGYVGGLVSWLNELSPLEVKEAEEGEKIVPGTVYFASSKNHMMITSSREIMFVNSQPADSYYPSCDKLLTSVASVYRENCVGVILTGLGDDGLRGMKTIRGEGGTTIAQDEASCYVYGMSKAVIESGYVDHILPLQEIGSGLKRLVGF